MELVELRAHFIMNKFSIATNLAAHLGCDMPHRAVCSGHAGVGTHIRHIFVPQMSRNSRGSRVVVVFVVNLVKMAYWQDFSNLISCAGTLGGNILERLCFLLMNWTGNFFLICITVLLTISVDSALNHSAVPLCTLELLIPKLLNITFQTVSATRLIKLCLTVGGGASRFSHPLIILTHSY